ncbi:MAG: ubiquinol-cytochrome c reductase iron-sulfur subunit [Acidimicrobiia bacterium]
MDPSALLLVATVGLGGLALLFLFSTARDRDERAALRAVVPRPQNADGPRAVALAGPPVGAARVLERAVALERHRVAAPSPRAPRAVPGVPDEETLGVTRRQVLNRGIVSAMALGVSGFGAAMLAMLWPSLSGGFGAKIRVGKLEEILGEIATTKEPVYYAAGRLYLNPYPREAVAAAERVTAYAAVLPGYQQGLVALYQKCVHLGCRVPWCKTSQWFECPCHGSQYNRVGEKKGGPAPRGLDRFVVSIDDGTVVVDTSLIITGPPIGTNTTGQEAEGPHCVGAGAG